MDLKHYKLPPEIVRIYEQAADRIKKRRATATTNPVIGVRFTQNGRIFDFFSPPNAPSDRGGSRG